jgi:hypothetical protein
MRILSVIGGENHYDYHQARIANGNECELHRFYRNAMEYTPPS